MDFGICANLQMFPDKVPRRHYLPFPLNYQRYYRAFPQILNPWIPSLYSVTQTGHPYPNHYPGYRLQGNVPSQLTQHLQQRTKHSTRPGHRKLLSSVEPPKNQSSVIYARHSTSNVKGKLPSTKNSPRKESSTTVVGQSVDTFSQSTSNVQGKLLSTEEPPKMPNNGIPVSLGQSTSNGPKKELSAEDLSVKNSISVKSELSAVSVSQSTSTVKQRPILSKEPYLAVNHSQCTSSCQRRPFITANSLKRRQLPRKPYTKVTANKKMALLQAYKTNPYITGEPKKKLADQIGEPIVFVEKWFANRRHTEKKASIGKIEGDFGKIKAGIGQIEAGIVKIEILD